MKIAANPKMMNSFGYQVIFNDDFKAIGINLVCNKKILWKERFEYPKKIITVEQECDLAQKIIFKLLKNEK